jgi:hypothetical protein
MWADREFAGRLRPSLFMVDESRNRGHVTESWHQRDVIFGAVTSKRTVALAVLFE